MDKLTLLEKFSDENLIHSLSMGDKLLASIYVMILGMSVTIIALSILWGLIVFMSKALQNKGKERKEEVFVQQEQKINNETNEEELIAVITAAIAASMKTSTHNIVVKNIKRVADPTPAWGRAGRMEQMNRRVLH
ncbi:OadG family protein [Inediibacterium massiliense]|uniref:OadG family protein n=1 Tax=Inediibacterium massiliense TaxID=1658111 RepID=UPI0006B506C2|nr:OadG family protein [Inediibacterium massiliense]